MDEETSTTKRAMKEKELFWTTMEEAVEDHDYPRTEIKLHTPTLALNLITREQIVFYENFRAVNDVTI